MNSPYFCWCIHITRGPIFSLRTPNFFLREANANFGNSILCGAGCGEQGYSAETWGSWPVVLPRKTIFGFLLKTSGCFWLSSKALHENWQNLEKWSHSMWLLVFMYVRDMSRAVFVTIRLNDNSLQNCTWYMPSKAAVKCPWVSSLSGIFHPKWKQDFLSVTLLRSCL